MRPPPEFQSDLRLCGGADVWRGRLFWISFKVLFYDDLIGVVTSRHVTKMAVTLLDPTRPKPLVIRKLQSSLTRPKLLPIKV